MSEILQAARIEVIKTGSEEPIHELFDRPEQRPDLLIAPIGELSPSTLPQLRRLRSSESLRGIPILGVGSLAKKGLDFAGELIINTCR